MLLSTKGHNFGYNLEGIISHINRGIYLNSEKNITCEVWQLSWLMLKCFQAYLLTVWKHEWRPTRNGWFEAVSKTCFSVWTQSISSSSVTSSFFITCKRKAQANLQLVNENVNFFEDKCYLYKFCDSKSQSSSLYKNVFGQWIVYNGHEKKIEVEIKISLSITIWNYKFFHTINHYFSSRWT